MKRQRELIAFREAVVQALGTLDPPPTPKLIAKTADQIVADAARRAAKADASLS